MGKPGRQVLGDKGVAAGILLRGAGLSMTLVKVGSDRIRSDQASTFAIASAVRSTLPLFSPATHIRPERTR